MFAELISKRYGHINFLSLCYAVIAFGIISRVVYIFGFNPASHVWSDPARHWEQGIDVLRSDPMSQIDPIFYQLYIGALAKLTLGIPELIAFYTALLSCITPWIWYRFLRELQPSKTVAVAGWAVLSLIPSWIGIYGYYMQETLMLPLLGAALYTTWRCRRKETPASFLVMIILWTLAGLTRGICIPMAAVAATWLWVVQPQKLTKAVFTILCMGLLMGPLIYRGYHIMNIFAPHGIGYMNMIYAKSGAAAIKISFTREGAVHRYLFQSPVIDNKPFEPLSEWTSAREGTVELMIDIDEGIDSWRGALQSDPLSLDKYLWITGENLINLFFAPSWPDSNRALVIGEINHQTRWIWPVLTLVCLIGLIVFWGRQRRLLLLPSIILIWFIVQGLVPISVNEGRYRMPLYGLLVAQAILLIRRDETIQEVL